MTFALNIFERGGPVMWPLLACSILSLAVTIERLLFWWALKRRKDRTLIDRIFALTEKADFAAAMSEGTASADSRAQVLLAALKHKDHGPREAMEVAAMETIDGMKHGLSVLDTIVTMAPLLGILGTVTGIIESFDLLGAAGIEDPRAVTSGIAQALITTAAGLTVALATLIPLNYFTAQTQREAKQLSRLATQFEVAFRRGRGTTQKPCN